MQILKRAYAHAMHGLGNGLHSSGLLKRPEPTLQGDVVRWLHSLFAIYDIEAMVKLDLPWWTLRATALVDRFLAGRTAPQVFEYGSGASTVFLAKRAEIVVSAEHDPKWHALVTEKVASHANVLATLVEAPPAEPDCVHWSRHPAWSGRDFRDYVHAIDRFAGQFDLIVIDGRCRAHCLKAALRRVKPDGLILFDNAGRRRYRAALETCALTKLKTSGLTACLPYPDATVLLAPDPKVLQNLVEGG